MDDVRTIETRLLYNIQELLKDISENIKPKEIKLQKTDNENTEGFKCKHCKEIHKNRSELTKCALKHKKKG